MTFAKIWKGENSSAYFEGLNSTPILAQLTRGYSFPENYPSFIFARLLPHPLSFLLLFSPLDTNVFEHIAVTFCRIAFDNYFTFGRILRKNKNVKQVGRPYRTFKKYLRCEINCIAASSTKNSKITIETQSAPPTLPILLVVVFFVSIVFCSLRTIILLVFWTRSEATRKLSTRDTANNELPNSESKAELP